MAVSMDTYDEESGIHPRNKQLVTKRLAISGLNVAYGLTDNPTNGPFPKSVKFYQEGLLILAKISFDEPISFDVKEHSGFYYCCQTDFQSCDPANAWEMVRSKIGINQLVNTLIAWLVSEICGQI
jgi:hypothetical protein